jgi:hypothetical protein
MKTEISLSSNTLFHFTNKAENLINILNSGFSPRFCLEQFGSSHLLTGKTRNEYDDSNWEEAIPITCFCDLPISHISSHLEFYGSYGIGLSKNWGIKNGLTPLTYIHENSCQLEYLSKIIRAAWKVDELNEKFDRENTRLLFMELSGFFKPYEGEMWRINKYVTKRFYDEREWRYVPFIVPKKTDENNKFKEDYRLTKDEFLNEIKRAKANKYLNENHPLKFEFEDIKYIIIKNDNEAKAMTEAIYSNNKFTDEQKIILSTKIISTEQIKEDF